MATVTVAVAVWVSVKVGLAVVDVATGIGVAELVGVADAVLTTVADADGVADVVADATRVGVAVCSASPDAAGGGSNPHSRPATTRTGTTIRLINGRMRVSMVKWISDNSLGLYLPNPIPTLRSVSADVGNDLHGEPFARTCSDGVVRSALVVLTYQPGSLTSDRA